MTVENVLIIAVKKDKVTDDHFESSVEELQSLSYTAGGNVVKVVTQNREQIHPVTYIGKGKVTEVEQWIAEYDVSLVIANDELSPGQLRNLNDRFDIRVIDRSQLILDIFASRAKTKEGQLQVELAQLQYTLPRLHGMGLVLSRLGGGIGTRGPGETKLESDQRHIRRRIDEIKRRLDDVVKQREQYRKRRKLNQAYQIAIVGYTNAGKSTLFNQLTNETSLQEDLLFATLDPLTRKVTLPSGFDCLLTDTVGFIQDLPTSLIAAFKSTLEEVTEADLLLHVVDASHDGNEQQQETVLNILGELNATNIPILTVYNKADLLEEDFIPLHHPNILVSALQEGDDQRLLEKIEATMQAHMMYYDVTLGTHEGKVLHQLSEQTILIEQKFNEATNVFQVRGYMQENHPLQRIIKEQTEEDDNDESIN